MRIVNALRPKSPVEPEVTPVVVAPKSDVDDLQKVVPDDSNLQKMIHNTSEASQRRVYKKFILDEANKRRAEMSGLMFVHVRQRKLPDRANFGGVTVAFKLPVRSNKTVFALEIATCVCPGHVQLDKKFGASFAALNFLNRRTINVPIWRNLGESDKDAAVRALTEMFL